jgi:hypothetical protein
MFFYFHKKIMLADATSQALSDVLAGLLRIEAELAAARAAAIEPVAGAAELAGLDELCITLVILLEGEDSLAQVQTTHAFEQFAARVPVPPKLLGEQKRSHLIKFVVNAPKTVQRKLLESATERAENSEAVCAAVAAAAAARSELVWAHRAALARSDHVPTRVTLRIPASACHSPPWPLRVSSLNVQELIEDGVNTYVGSILPSIGGGDVKGAAKLLISAILDHPCVRQQQEEAICDFVAAEFGRCAPVGEGGVEDAVAPHASQAVCLQEVSRPLLAALQARAAVSAWHVHHSTPPPLDPAARRGACVALTCIVVRSDIIAAAVGGSVRLTAEDDVVVDVPRRNSDGFRTRRFAALTLERTSPEAGAASWPTITLVSTHVLHALTAIPLAKPPPSCSGPAQGPDSPHRQPSNIAHMWQAVVEIGAALEHRLRTGGVVLAAGDFNGPPSQLLGPKPAEEESPPLNPCAPEWVDQLRSLPTPAPGHTGHDGAVDPQSADPAPWTAHPRPCLGFRAAEPDQPTQVCTPLAVDGAVAMCRARLGALCVSVAAS